MRDRREDPELDYSILSANFPTTLAVPLLRDGVVLGAITVTRAEARLFSQRQIELLQTFADQAVIAIENVRLFTELQEKNRALTEAHAQVTEALEQQTATSEILRVISSSPTDVQPVFDVIVRSATRLCGALFSALFRLHGEIVHFEAHHNFSAEGLAAFQRSYPARLDAGLVTTRAIAECRVIHVPDTLDDPVYESAGARDHVHRLVGALGHRSLLVVPMIREGRATGSINVARAEPRPFTDKQIELLKTFADQAVIAIENVRLFTELQASNRELTTALDTQTATSDILRVISRSQTDVQPVFEVIVESAVRLCGARFGRVYHYDGALIHLVAGHGLSAGAAGEFQRVFPRRASDDTLVGRVIVTRQPACGISRTRKVSRYVPGG